MKKQRLIPTIIVFIMIMNCLLPIIPVQVQAVDNNAIYLSSELYEALKEELRAKGIVASYSDSQSKITITEENRAKVTSLDLKNSEISDLTGLEKFTNLTELNLSGNRLTSDSNLEVFNNFQLKKLDISTNYIDDISMIENYEEIESLSIQNQTIEDVVVLDKDAISNLDEGKIRLPQILDLIEDFNEFKYENPNGITISAINEGFDYIEADNNAPHFITVEKLLDEEGNVNSGYLNVYFKINAGELIDTTINLHYIVINEEERAAVFKEDNFYKTVKAQLTKGQVIYYNGETVEAKNSELRTSKGEDNLYKNAYDNIKVLVFDLNTLMNEIPSLKIEGREVTDISGIEAFIGLETELDLSNNYINSIEKLIELQMNKEKETNILQEKFRKQKERIAKQREKFVKSLEKIEKLEEDIEKNEYILLNPKSVSDIEKADKALNGYINSETGKEEKGLYEKRELAVESANAQLDILKILVNDLYVIYKNYYRTTTLLTVEISQMDEIKFNSREEALNALNMLFTKIANLEETRGLSDFEKEMLINDFAMDLIDEEGEEIKNPITNHFVKILEDAEYLTISSCKYYIEKIIDIDTKVQLKYNFPSIYKNGKGLEELNIEEVFEEAKEELVKYSSELVEGKVNKELLTDDEKVLAEIASNWDIPVRTIGTQKVLASKEEQRNYGIQKIVESLEGKTIYEYAQENYVEYFIEYDIEFVNFVNDVDLDTVLEILKEIVDSNTKNKIEQDKLSKEELDILITEHFNEIVSVIKGWYIDGIEDLEAYINSFIDGMISKIMIETATEDFKNGVNKEDWLQEILFEEPSTDKEKESWEIAYKKFETYYKDSAIQMIFVELINVHADEILKVKPESEYELVDESVPQEPNDLKSLSQILGISGKVVNLTDEEIEAWVEVPELKVIRMGINCLPNIDGIECFNGLEILDVSDNEITDISNVKWENLTELEELYINKNAIGDISMLDVIKKLVVLNASKNKLSGKFNLDVDKLERLVRADFSENAYDDLINLFMSYTIEAGTQDVHKYVYENVITQNDMPRLIFDMQYITEDLGKVVAGEQKYVKVPAIITQLEKMKPSDTYFTYEGYFEGKISANGKVQLVTDDLGKHSAILYAYSEDDHRCFSGLRYIANYEVVKGMVKDIDVAINEDRNYAILDGETKFVASLEADENVTDISVNWEIEGNISTDTEISDNGVLFVSEDELADKITVIATSNFDNTKTSKITVDVKKAEIKVDIISVANKEGIKTETSKVYRANVETEANNKNIIWAILGNTSENTTISEDGVLYIAKDEAAGGEITIIAISEYNNEVFDELTEIVINDEYIAEPENPGDTTESIEPENPGDTTKPTEPENPGNTTAPTQPEEVEINYHVKDSIVYVEKLNMTIAEFKAEVISGEHTVTVSNGAGENITDDNAKVLTGMVVCIDDKLENTFEIAVLGDINADGKIDGLDTNFVKAHRVETKVLEGVAFAAADVNKDGIVNKIDSFLILFYRADKIENFLKETVEKALK